VRGQPGSIGAVLFAPRDANDSPIDDDMVNRTIQAMRAGEHAIGRDERARAVPDLQHGPGELRLAPRRARNGQRANQQTRERTRQGVPYGAGSLVKFKVTCTSFASQGLWNTDSGGCT